MNKCLLCITGESFRNGPQNSRLRDDSTYSIINQMRAIKSHFEFITHLKNSYNNITIDVLLNIYSFNTQKDNELINSYQDNSNIDHVYLYLKYELLGEYGLLFNTYDIISNELNYDDYTFILFFRIDLFLKPYFNTVFDLREKIRFTHVNEIYKNFNNFNIGMPHEKFHAVGIMSEDKTFIEKPLIGYQILYVPHKYFNTIHQKKIYFHGSYPHILQLVPKEDIDFFLYTFHSSSTDISWNPIFHLVGRKECKKWHCKGLIVDPITFEIQYKKDFDLYDHLENNDFNNEDCGCKICCRDG